MSNPTANPSSPPSPDQRLSEPTTSANTADTTLLPTVPGGGLQSEHAAVPNPALALAANASGHAFSPAEGVSSAHAEETENQEEDFVDPEDPEDPFGDDEYDHATTASLSSSITRYRYENGRRYHAYKDGEYWGPNDEQAADHLDIANHLYLLMLKNKLYLAPITKHPQKVLDVGTGTGIWAIDFADQHPSAEVIGTELSPIQPSWVPPNCKFEIDDAQDEWTFKKNSFDFIHVRSLFGCIADWPKFYREVLKHLRPGAYLEQVEMAPGFRSDDGSMDPSTAYGQWHDLGVDCGRKMGKSFETMYEMKGFIEAAGFEDIVEQTFKLPIGPWMPGKANKEMGMWARLHVEEGLENWAMAPLTRVLGWSKQDVDIFIAYMKRDLKSKRVHGHHEMRVIYARKPLDWVP